MAANQQRRQKRTHEMDTIGAGVGSGLALREFSNLRRSEALERARASSLRQRLIAADRGLDLGALGRRARIHPDGRDVTREQRPDLFGERTRRIEAGEPVRGRSIEIHASMLLSGSRYGHQLPEIEPALLQALHHQLERLDP